MSKKKHHFVPQFYLRNFSKDGASICLVNIARSKPIQEASIRNQCYRHKFYGETNEMEDTLAQMEHAMAQTTRAIIEGGPVRRYSRNHFYLIHFLAIQLLRTRAAAERAAREASLMATYLARELFARTGQDDDHIREVLSQVLGENVIVTSTCDHQHPGSSSLRAVVNPGVNLSMSVEKHYATALRDLDIRVIRVECDARFITSDNPVIVYNQWCEGIHDQGVTGAACGGLQIFFPLNPSAMLMLYDEHVYKVDSRNAGEIVITHPRDVHHLNRLQCIFAQDNLFFSKWGDKDQILGALPKVAHQRNDHVEKLQVATAEQDDLTSGIEGELVIQYTQMPDAHLKLRFSSLRRWAREIPLFERSEAYRHHSPQPDAELSEEENRELESKRFVLRSTEAWPAEWGNLVP